MLHTSLIRHEIFGLVFAVVEAAGQNHIVIGTLRKNKKQSHPKTQLPKVFKQNTMVQTF